MGRTVERNIMIDACRFHCVLTSVLSPQTLESAVDCGIDIKAPFVDAIVVYEMHVRCVDGPLTGMVG